MSAKRPAVKRYVIEHRPVSYDGDREPEWRATGPEYVDLGDAEREWFTLNELNGHDTYHRLVEVRRRVLRQA